MTDNEFIFPQRKCTVCRKQFHMTDGWVYKIKKNGYTKVFCSWRCLRAWEAGNHDVTKGELREMVRQAIRDGLTTTEIINLLGVTGPMVYYWREKMKGEREHEKVCGSVDGAAAGADPDGERDGGNGLGALPAEQPGEHQEQGFGEK